MKNVLLISLCLLVGFSCSREHKKEVKREIAIPLEDTTEIPQDESGIPEPQYITDPGLKKIVSVTDTLYKGDTLHITFKIPHPKDLAIIDPDEHFLFLVYSLPDSSDQPLAIWDEFGNTKELTIITDQTKVKPWDVRMKEKMLIFNKSGIYEIRLSENLETDDGTPVEVEKVVYYNQTK